MDYKLEHKGYQGSVSYCAANKIFVGIIEAISEVVIFEGSSIKQLRQEFELAVDYYLEFCQVEGVCPQPVRKQCRLAAPHG
jgi:predicted HicB family RNase H-like nuclease